MYFCFCRIADDSSGNVSSASASPKRAGLQDLDDLSSGSVSVAPTLDPHQPLFVGDNMLYEDKKRVCSWNKFDSTTIKVRGKHYKDRDHPEYKKKVKSASSMFECVKGTFFNDLQAAQTNQS